MTYIVGVTGGIGSGKSTITHLFQALGVPVVDADEAARKVVAPQSDILLEIITRYGVKVLDENGEMNRRFVRECVFNNPKEMSWLNNLLHPAIQHQCEKELKLLKSDYGLFVAPLLIENNLTSICQSILVVDCKPQIQLQRATKRDKNRSELIQKIINAQISREERLKWATEVIKNDLPFEENFCQLAQKVLDLHALYVKKAAEFK